MPNFYEESPERYQQILKALSGFDLDITPDGIESHVQQAEDFWRSLWEQCPETDPTGQIKWIREQIPKYFRSINNAPKWIQNPNWQFAGGMPMIFVDQIDVKRSDENLAGKFFHDDVSYYLFIPSYDLIQNKDHYADRLIMQRW